MVAITALAAALRLYRLTAVPGLQHDEALGGLFAVDITHGHWPIFFRVDWEEPLFYYVEALAILLLGQTAVALRLVGAAFGIATVPATYLLLREWLSRRVAVLGTLLLALSYWHLHESRLAYRAISQPFFEVVALLALWRGWQRRSWRWHVVAGLAGGACMYTYLSSRVFPAVPLAFGLWLLLSRRPARRVLAALGLALGVWALVFAPLGVFFLRHPVDFSGRTVQVSVFSTPDPWRSLRQSLAGTLGMFSFHGDYLAKYNQPGKPVFDWPLSACFYLGLAVCAREALSLLVRLRPPSSALVRADACALLLAWTGIMLAPGILSTESPQFLRTLGVVPTIFGVAALGMEHVGTWLARWLPSAHPLLPVAAGLLLAYEGGSAASVYFGQWQRSNAAFYGLHGDAAAIADWLRQHPGVTAYVSTEYPHHPTIRFLAPEAANRVHWFNGREAAVLPADRAAVVFYPRDYRPRFVDPTQVLPPAERRWSLPDAEGGAAVTAFRAADGRLPELPHQTSADVGGALGVTGYALPTQEPAGEEAYLLLGWTTGGAQEQALRFFAHLEDAQGHRWAQRDGQGFFADSWQPGDRVVSAHVLRLPPWTPPVEAAVRVGVYAPAEQRALMVRAAGAPEADFLEVGRLRVLPPARPAAVEPSPRHRLGRPLGPALTLLGYDLTPEEAAPGSDVGLVLYWHVLAALPSDARVVVTLSRVGAALAAEDHALLAADFPPAAWRPGQALADPHQLHIPAGATAGRWRLGVHLDGADAEVGDLAVLTPPRQFTLPPVSHELKARLGEAILLKGYDLEAGGPGELRLSLVWQALAELRGSYKVFTHLLDAANRVVAQRDDLPGGGRLPTSGWAPGQVVRDEYRIPLPADLPPGTYQLEVGMYAPASGQRLPVSQPGQPPGDRVLLQPVTLER